MSDNESESGSSSSGSSSNSSNSDSESSSSESTQSGKKIESATTMSSSKKSGDEDEAGEKKKAKESGEESSSSDSSSESDGSGSSSESDEEEGELKEKSPPAEVEDSGPVSKKRKIGEEENGKLEEVVPERETETPKEDAPIVETAEPGEIENGNGSETPEKKEPSPKESPEKIKSVAIVRSRSITPKRKSEPERKKSDEKARSRSRTPKRRDERDRRRSRDRERDRDREDRKRRNNRSRTRSRDRNRRRDRDRSRDREDPRNRSRSPKRTRDNKNDRKPDTAGSQITAQQRKTVDLLTSRTGGAYIPPAKLRMMQAEITDKASAAYQRIAWEALKKSIHGYINKVNVDNIGIITRELLKENIVRGRGLLCRSIIQAQAASPTFTHVYAALVSIINSKFPNIGELLLKRLVIQFKRGFRRNDKNICLSSSRFVAHLVNQRVAHEILALEILTLLVETPTDDSVEVAIAFLKECGMKLTEVSSKGISAIFEMLKNILHEGKLDKRVQYMIEVVFQVRKDGFKDHQSVVEALELVEEDDQFTHLMMLDEATNTEDVLNVFKLDEKYEENENKYKGLSKELLGSDADDSDASSNGSGDSDDDDDDENDEEEEKAKAELIIDNTETNLVALRRTIYLTIHSSLDYEECAHKLMKMQLKPGQEIELCHMFLDCCAEQRTYEKFYGLLAQRFCSINKVYIGPFEEIFKDSYSTTHRLDTNRLRNVSKFFAHLLFTDAIGWDVFDCIKLNEDDTTSSSRIFIKILFQELAEYMGLKNLNDKLKDPAMIESLSGLFPRDNPRNTRFAINFFTSIGLGGLTDGLREFLKNAPKTVPAINQEILAVKDNASSSSSSSSSSDSDSSSSSSASSSSSPSSSSDSSEDEKKKRKKKKKKPTKKTETKKNAVKKKKKKKVESSSSSSSSSSDSSDSSSTDSSSSDEESSKKKSKKNKKKKMTKKGENGKKEGNAEKEKNKKKKNDEVPDRRQNGTDHVEKDRRERNIEKSRHDEKDDRRVERDRNIDRDRRDRRDDYRNSRQGGFTPEPRRRDRSRERSRDRDRDGDRYRSSKAAPKHRDRDETRSRRKDSRGISKERG